MPDRVRVSRLSVTSVVGTRIRMSRLSANTAAVVATGNRLRVSRLSATTAFAPTFVSRIRVSRLSVNATVTGPGVYLWTSGKIVIVDAWMWLSGQIVPATSPSAIVLPPNPPVPTDVYSDTYRDTYGA